MHPTPLELLAGLLALLTALALTMLLLYGCTHDDPTDPTPIWTVRESPTKIPVDASALCGLTTCWSQGITEVRGYTDARTRTITVWADAPPDVLQWEQCNAARYDRTGVLVDRGCPP